MIWKITVCFIRMLRESRYVFVIECRFNELHFELFYGIFLLADGTIFRSFFKAFYTFGSITPFDADLTQKLVQGACYETSSSYFYSFHDHTIPLLFLLFLLVLYSWLWSIRLSYGIDSSITIILRFALDKRTISDLRPLLNIVLG